MVNITINHAKQIITYVKITIITSMVIVQVKFLVYIKILGYIWQISNFILSIKP